METDINLFKLEVKTFSRFRTLSTYFTDLVIFYSDGLI